MSTDKFINVFISQNLDNEELQFLIKIKSIKIKLVFVTNFL
jgi:hypothetical protein